MDKSGHQRGRASEGHSLPVERRGRGKLGHWNNASKHETLTLYEVQRRDRSGHKDSGWARDTHDLSSTRGISQDPERKRANKGHSLPIERRGTRQKHQKKSEPAKGTHSLSSAEGGQVRKTRERSERGHSLPVKCRWRGRSEHQKKSIERGSLTTYQV